MEYLNFLWANYLEGGAHWWCELMLPMYLHVYKKSNDDDDDDDDDEHIFLPSLILNHWWSIKILQTLKKLGTCWKVRKWTQPCQFLHNFRSVPVAECLVLPSDHEVPGSNPTGGGIQLMTQNLSSLKHTNIILTLLNPTFKTGSTGVYIIFHISAQKHKLWVLARTASPRWF